MKLWNRYTELTAGQVLIPADGPDIEFSIESGGTGSEAGTAEIRIYNLSRATREKLIAGDEVTLTAGYLGDAGPIFLGTINAVEDEPEGTDTRTIITCTNRTFPVGVEPRVYGADTPLGTIVLDAYQAADITPGHIDDCGITTKADYTSDTDVAASLAWCRQQAEGADIAEEKKPFRYYVQGGAGHFAPADYTRPDTEKIVLDADTGLIATQKADPDDASCDRTITALLLWRVEINSLVELTSRIPGASGMYRVVAYTHRNEADEYVTELQVKAL